MCIPVIELLLSMISGTIVASKSMKSSGAFVTITMSSNISKTKFDETDMLLLDSSTFDWDAYLCETPTDLDVQPLLTIKSENDLFNDFNAALTDLTSTNVGTNEFDAFDYSTRNSLFDDEEHSNPFEKFQINLLSMSFY